jgi:hypothetical protein
VSLQERSLARLSQVLLDSKSNDKAIPVLIRLEKADFPQIKFCPVEFDEVLL